MGRILPTSFFRRPVLQVARALLGKFLVRKVRGKAASAMIMEVEAYDGLLDKACHAAHGKTLRNEVMFGSAGRWYVYFVYGMHWMLNIVTGEEDYPAAVLIRTSGEWNGPAKLTKALKIDGSLNGKIASKASGLWIEDRGVKVLSCEIKRLPRIGVAYAGAWAKKPYRFVFTKPKEGNTSLFSSKNETEGG